MVLSVNLTEHDVIYYFYLTTLFLIGLSGSMMYVPDCQLVQDDDDVESSGRSGACGIGGDNELHSSLSTPHILISTTKVTYLKIHDSNLIRFFFQLLYSLLLEFRIRCALKNCLYPMV